MKAIKPVFIFVMFTMLLSCPDQDKFEPDSTLEFKNTSDMDLLIQFDFNRFPDTSIIQSNPFQDEKQFELGLIKANSTLIEEGEFIAILASSNTPMMLFVFSRDSIEQLSWEEIQDGYKVLRRYDLTLEDLEALNWTIAYP